MALHVKTIARFLVIGLVTIVFVHADGCFAQEALGPKSSAALQAINTSIAREPSNAALYVTRAKFWMTILRANKAQKDLDRSISIKPTPQAYLALAKLRFDPTDTNPAIEAYDKARALSDGDYLMLVDIAQGYGELKAFDKQREAYLAAFKLHQKAASAETGLASALFQLHDYNGAIKYSSAGIAKAPKSVLAGRPPIPEAPILHEWRKWTTKNLQTRGASFMEAHRYEDALRDLNKAYEICTPEYMATTLVLRKKLYSSMGLVDLETKDDATLQELRDAGAKDFLHPRPYSLFVKK